MWSGLTTVVDVAVGPDGALYALELSTGNLAEPPFLTPGSGRVVRQTGPDTSEVVLEGLMFPIAMEIGPDGMIYVSTAGDRRQRRQRSHRELRPERAACRRDDARGRRRLRPDRRDAVTGDRLLDTAGCLGRSGPRAGRLGGSRHRTDGLRLPAPSRRIPLPARSRPLRPHRADPAAPLTPLVGAFDIRRAAR